MKGSIIMALEDKLNQAKGALKENAGKLTGDKEMQAEGAVEKTTAKVKDVAEDVKDAVDGALNGLKTQLITIKNKLVFIQ
ncbi:CsbD family protein [Veillonella sp.]|uniref:CsbD family protein n=1 Tax=Veillonella sp. TaxID=1926307 RepID=UPI0035A0C49D